MGYHQNARFMAHQREQWARNDSACEMHVEADCGQLQRERLNRQGAPPLSGERSGRPPGPHLASALFDTADQHGHCRAD